MLANGIGYRTQENLFRLGKPVGRAIARLGTYGLGSDTTVAASVSDAVAIIENELIKPALQLVVENLLPFAVLMDGSQTRTGGGGEGELIFVYHPLAQKPFPVDAVKLLKSPNAEVLVNVARTSTTAYISPDNYDLGYSILAADHASVMRRAARISGAGFCGDPPHGLALVIKVIASAMGVHPVLKIARRVLVRKNATLHKAVVTAFEIDAGLFNMPSTRWGYVTRMLRFMADTKQVGKLQQLLLYLLRDGSVPAASVTGLVPDEEAASDDEEEEEEENDDEDDDASPPSKRAAAQAARQKVRGMCVEEGGCMSG
jgi:hypothetical protein